jgi:hypothetical protein
MAILKILMGFFIDNFLPQSDAFEDNAGFQTGMNSSVDEYHLCWLGF